MSPRFEGLPFASGERVGLRALAGEHRPKVKCRDSQKTRNILASVDVDASMRESQPDAPRWDYVIWYDGIAPYLPCIEVHPANSGHVEDVIRKRDWLESILAGRGLPDRRYFWVPTADMALPKSGLSFRKISESGIRIKRIVFLDE